MPDNKLFYIAAKAYIEDSRGRILLLYVGVPHNAIKTNYWDLPGGRIREGDTAQQTLKTELLDEIGLTIADEPSLLTAVVSNHDAIIDGHERGLALFIYQLAIPEVSPITLSSEHTAYEWVDKKEAAKRLSDKYPKEFTETLA